MSDKSAIIKEVQKYLARGQIDKAIAECEKLAKEYPDGTTYNTIGDLYLKKGDKTSAVDSFHKAANFFRHEGFSPKALALYKKILNINPTESEALFSLGELNEEKGLITDAIKYYLATVDSLSKGGKKEKLLDIYDKILALSPANIHLRNKVAEIYSKEGIMSEAAKQYFQIAMLYFDKGDMENSMGYYQKVLDVQPLNKEAILGISYLYERSGNLEQAIEQVKEAANLFPEDTDIHLRSAEIYIMARRFDEARDSLRKVIEVEPANIKARRLLGDVFIAKGMQKEALNCYREAIEITPDDDSLKAKVIELEKVRAEYISLKGEKAVDGAIVEADIYLQYGLYENVRNLLEPFKQSEPENLELHVKLKSLYVNTGDKEQAITECLILNDLYEKAGDIAKSEQIIKEAHEIYPEDPRLVGLLKEEEDVEEKQKELVVTEGEILEAEEITEPALESDVMDMPGVCYMEKGLYPLAIDVLKNAIDKMKDTGESYWAMKYDLAEAYEKNGNLKEALDLYAEIYEWNSKFRFVSDKVNSLGAMVSEEDVGQKKPRSRKDRVSYI